MINFRWQLDCVTGCPDIWLDIILGVSGRVFLEDIRICISRLSKDPPHQCGWASSNPSRARIEQKGGGRENSLSAWLFKLGLQSSPVLGLGIKPSAFLVLRLSQVGWNYTTCFPGSPACRQRTVEHLILHNHVDSFL